jgi:hypothetical protein
MNLRVEILSVVVLTFMAIAPRAEADDPERVRPSTGTVGALRAASAEVADTLSGYLDEGHDWLYRRVQHLFEDIDVRFVGSEQAPIVVPLSPLRIGFGGQLIRREGGGEFAATPDFEASVLLPNLERRLKLFITSSDLQESPRDPTDERNPVRVGARFAPRSHIDFELGVRAKMWPAGFAALRWTPEFTAGTVRVRPFAKTYVESGLGFGASGGLTLERWNDRWFARSASYANWVRNTSATDWSQSFIAGYARAVIQERRYDSLATGHDLACGVAARLSVSGDRVSRTTVYEASVLMKRPLHGGWLYGYIEPVVRWERDFGWHPDVGVRIGFDALFWGLASLPAEVATYCR